MIRFVVTSDDTKGCSAFSTFDRLSFQENRIFVADHVILTTFLNDCVHRMDGVASFVLRLF